MAELVMLGILLFASYFDWKTRKIPNSLIAIGMLFVLVRWAATNHLQGFLWSVLSMAAVFIICWPVYLIRGLGAGDIKLFLLLTGVSGIGRMLHIAVITFLLASIFSFIKILLAGDLGIFFKNLFHSIFSVFSGLFSGLSRFFSVFSGLYSRLSGLSNIKGEEKHTVMLAPFMTMGYFFVLLGRGWI